MDFYGCHFEYAGISSRTYGLIIANIETARNTSISGKVATVALFNKREKRNLYITTSYKDSPIQFDAEVVSETPIDLYRQREIEKWLFHRHGYKKLYMDIIDDVRAESYELIDGEQKRLYLNCRFTNPAKLEYNGGVVGYQFTVECDGCMAWQDAISKTYALAHTDASGFSTFDLCIDTDISDYVYPKVTFVVGTSGGNVSIVNNSDDSSRVTEFVELPANAIVVINGATNYVSGNYYDYFAYKNFIRLLDGDNKLSVLGDVQTISFEWQNMRYV